MDRATRARRWGLCAAAAVGLSVLAPVAPASAGTWSVFVDHRSGASGEAGTADPGTLVSTDGGATFRPATVVAPPAEWPAPTLGQWVSSDAERGTSTAGTTTLFRSEFRIPPGPIGADLEVCVYAVDAAVVTLNGAEVGTADGAAPAECLDLPLAQLVGGYNELEFAVSNAAGEMGLHYRVSGVVDTDDTVAPVLVLPDDVVVDATGADGAFVQYSAGGIFHGPGPWPIPSCTPPSGGTFPVGTTTVTCTATNPTSGASSTGTFTVTVVAPNQPPALQLPGDLTVAATSSAGAAVQYTVTATDDGAAEPTVSCAPVSGTTFVVGTTTVTCTATDDEGLTDTGSFTVTVTPAAPTYLERLGTSITEGRKIRADIRRLLAAKHAAATDAFADGRKAAGCRVLREMDGIVVRHRGAGIPVGKATNLRNLIKASRADARC